ncbi:MAG: Lrp/AsnC family transcriptional regulator [Parasphingorhabdus sp.]
MVDFTTIPKRELDMDALDRRILRAIQEDSSQSAEKLADICNTSPSTILRRLAQLRKDKVIRGEVALLDAAALGRPLMMIIRVGLTGENKVEAQKFIDDIAKEPGVVQFYFVTGQSDYIMIYNARTMEEYDDFIQNRILSNSFVATANSNVIIRAIKSGFSIPIDEPDNS